MIRNYFKTAWRNILKHRFNSIVNITGLAMGMTFTLLIAAFIWKEWSVNKSLRNAGNQYIIQSKWKEPSQGFEIATAGPLAKALKESYPGLVANYYRYDGITSTVSRGDKAFREGLQVGDSTLLGMYGFRLLHGNPATALNHPFSIVLTGEKAVKYFGRTDVVGETITIENFSGSRKNFMITGVLAELPRNSVTRLVDNYENSFFIPESNLDFFGRNMEWYNTSIASYIELKPGVQPADLVQPMQDVVRQHAQPQVSANMTPYLVSLEEYHLSANKGLVKKMLYTLSAIAFFILLMAVINFINMSVSRSAVRMREIGIRKVLGGSRKQLIIQFLAESVIVALSAACLALGLYVAVKDVFGNVLGRQLPVFSEFPVYFFLFPVVLAVSVGLIAGVYPAFVLSSLKAVESVKGKLTVVKENSWFRKSLMGFQFATATVVFTGAIIISQQVRYFFRAELGYDRDYIVTAQVPRDWSIAGVSRMEHIRSQFAGMPEVRDVSLSFEMPDGNNGGNVLVFKNGADSATAISAQLLNTDEYYARTYDIHMAAGIFYSQPGAFTDSSKLVINEMQATALGWKNAQDAVGQLIHIQGINNAFTIAGVTKDFHFGSLQAAIPPIVFMHVSNNRIFRFFSFKLKAGGISHSITALQKQWAVLMPGAPFEYNFMDDTLKKMYRSELQLKKASSIATVLSFIIVLLGVIGLVSLSMQRRTREIGIRKVLGSSIPGIIVLFMKEFLGVILVAGTAACPVAYFIMNGWLNDYAYRINLTPAPFVLAVLLLALLTACLIIAQTIKAALHNPVKSLRTE